MTRSSNLKAKEEDQKSLERKPLASPLGRTNEIHILCLTLLPMIPLRRLPLRMTLTSSLRTSDQAIRSLQVKRRLKASSWEGKIIRVVTLRRKGTFKSKVFELWESDQWALNSTWTITWGLVHIVWVRIVICTWEGLVDDQMIEWGMWVITFR